MTIMDSCAEFVQAVGAATRDLSRDVEWYSTSGCCEIGPEKMNALLRACRAAVAREDDTFDCEAGARLLRAVAALEGFGFEKTPDWGGEEGARILPTHAGGVVVRASAEALAPDQLRAAGERVAGVTLRLTVEWPG